MFPTPTTTLASIRKALTGPRRPAAARASTAPEKPGSSGSTPRWAKWGSAAELRRRQGEDHAEAPRVAQPQPPAGAQMEGHVLVRARAAPPPATSVSRPLIPRWTTTVHPPSRSISRYFERRRSAITSRPRAAAPQPRDVDRLAQGGVASPRRARSGPRPGGAPGSGAGPRPRAAQA